MKKIYLSENAGVPLKKYLLETGYQLIEIKKSDQVYPAVSSHPDIYMCKINDNIIKSNNDLGFNYPQNIKYNGVQIGKYFVHNTDYTSPLLLSAVAEAGLILIKVKQGYTKCNIVYINENSIITSDIGISKVLEGYGIEVLLVSIGHVKLEGFPYGFLGGASGKIDSTIIFNGDLTKHPDYFKIIEFIENKNLKIKYFPEYELTDIGSIILE